MKGTIIKTENGWVISYMEMGTFVHPTFTEGVLGNYTMGEQIKTLPLYPDDVKQIEEWSKVFDNIEGRINSSPEVEFEIIPCIPPDLEPTRGETLSFEAIKYAKLIHRV